MSSKTAEAALWSARFLIEKIGTTAAEDSDTIRNAERWMKTHGSMEIENKREITVLCGSTRFRREFESAFRQEEHAGRICLTVPCFKDDPCCKTEVERDQLDGLHLAKIDLADRVVVLNINGYIGESTSGEIAYAVSHGKQILWANHFTPKWYQDGNYPTNIVEYDLAE